MDSNDKIRPFPMQRRDHLEDLASEETVDEMGLLDLIFIEEILQQRKQDKAG